MIVREPVADDAADKLGLSDKQRDRAEQILVAARRLTDQNGCLFLFPMSNWIACNMAKELFTATGRARELREMF